jgi:F-type H+-transporting ATPase subunit b
MQIISNIALISINETLIVQMVSFLIFLFIINRLMFRPLKDVMEQREMHIDTVKHEIDEAEHELDRMNRRIKEQETVVKNEAFKIRKEMEESGSREAGRIFQIARDEIMEKKKQAEKEIDSQIQSSRKQIKTEAEVLSISIIEKILDRRLAS